MLRRASFLYDLRFENNFLASKSRLELGKYTCTFYPYRTYCFGPPNRLTRLKTTVSIWKSPECSPGTLRVRNSHQFFENLIAHRQRAVGTRFGNKTTSTVRERGKPSLSLAKRSVEKFVLQNRYGENGCGQVMSFSKCFPHIKLSRLDSRRCTKSTRHDSFSTA